MTSVAIENNVPERGRTPEQQKYLDDVADAAERALKNVKATIADLQESLAERQAEAEQARAEADNGRIDTEDGV